MIKRNFIWLSLLAGVLLAIFMMPHQVFASNTAMHLAEPDEIVTIYDV